MLNTFRQWRSVDLGRGLQVSNMIVVCLCAWGVGVTVETAKLNDIMHRCGYFPRFILLTLGSLRP